ncbi:MAG: 30S ribosomal protein S6 [Bacteroidota bacterium]
MRQYEITFIVDPVLSSDEIKQTADNYVDHLKGEGCTIVHVDEMGLRQLAYPINRRNSGVYFCVEFQSENGNFIEKMELAMRRDARIMRFLTVSLDKYGVKYNEDKRNGLITPYSVKREAKAKAKAEAAKKRRDNRDRRKGGKKPSNKPPRTEAPKVEKVTETKSENTES